MAAPHAAARDVDGAPPLVRALRPIDRSLPAVLWGYHDPEAEVRAPR